MIARTPSANSNMTTIRPAGLADSEAGPTVGATSVGGAVTFLGEPDPPEPPAGVGVGGGVGAAANVLVTLAEQITRAPPPFVEPLH